MRLTIFNGSPRGMGGNSKTLIEWILEGIQQNSEVVVETLCLNKTAEHDRYVDKFKDSEIVLMVFPLYTDCMPGAVMAFIEKLQSLRNALNGVKMAFVVHSGFPEACQSRYVEKYLAWLAKDLGADDMGTVVLAGSEGMRGMTAKALEERRALFMEVGRQLVREKWFDAALLAKIAGWERLGTIGAMIVRTMEMTGVLNMEWDRQLKANRVYRERNARPYNWNGLP